MGNTMNSSSAGSHTKNATTHTMNSSSARFSDENTRPPVETNEANESPTVVPPPPPPKTELEKCEDISNELSRLEVEVQQFSGSRNDKSYLKLEEYLTRCLLKLDEIERIDDNVTQLRKRLINYTHQLSDSLDSKANSHVVNGNSMLMPYDNSNSYQAYSQEMNSSSFVATPYSSSNTNNSDFKYNKNYNNNNHHQQH